MSYFSLNLFSLDYDHLSFLSDQKKILLLIINGVRFAGRPAIVVTCRSPPPENRGYRDKYFNINNNYKP